MNIGSKNIELIENLPTSITGNILFRGYSERGIEMLQVISRQRMQIIIKINMKSWRNKREFKTKS